MSVYLEITDTTGHSPQFKKRIQKVKKTTCRISFDTIEHGNRARSENE